MPFGFHLPELIIILVVALLVFGPKKLPEMGSAVGKSIKEFRKGMNELSAPKNAEVVEAAPKEIIAEPSVPLVASEMKRMDSMTYVNEEPLVQPAQD